MASGSRTRPPRQPSTSTPVPAGGGVSTAPGGYVDWRQNPLDPMAPVGIRSRAVEPDTSKIRLGPL
ncbi:MAG: hypothetical protein ACRD12_03510, partial [Acidimicrobiales bacterium]